MTVIASEWTKLRALRSTYWSLLIAVVTAIGLSLVLAAAFAQPSSKGPPADPLLPGLASLEYAVLAAGILGALTITAEYSTGLISTTFAAVPRRRQVLAAKAAAVAGLTLMAGEFTAFVSFLADQAILASHHRGLSLGQPGVAGAVLADGLLLCVCALTGLGLGALIRHTAGAIAALAGVILLPALLAVLPAPWNDRTGRFTMVSAAVQVTQHHPSAALFAPAISMLVLLAWPTALLAAAAITISRRDA